MLKKFIIALFALFGVFAAMGIIINKIDPDFKNR